MAPKSKPKRARAKHYFREWREKIYPRQSDAEEALGWSQSKISRLEKGETPYDQDDLEIAASIFGCTPVDLITRGPDDPLPQILGEREIRAVIERIPGLLPHNVEMLVASIIGFQQVNAEQPSRNQHYGQSELANPHREEVPSR